jgi:hypothetical protein
MQKKPSVVTANRDSCYLASGRMCPNATVACRSCNSALAMNSYSICKSFSFSTSCCLSCCDAFSAIQWRRRYSRAARYKAFAVVADLSLAGRFFERRNAFGQREIACVNERVRGSKLLTLHVQIVQSREAFMLTARFVRGATQRVGA